MSPTLFNVYKGSRGRIRKEQIGVIIGKKIMVNNICRWHCFVSEKWEEIEGNDRKIQEVCGKEINFESRTINDDIWQRKRKEEKVEMKWSKYRRDKEIKYLGYRCKKNGRIEKHIMKRIRRATVAMKKTYSIREYRRKIV